MKKKDNNKNKKLTRIITLILCMMVTGGIVHAVDWVANADQVQFTPDKLKSTNVQDAIDEVYAEAVDYDNYKKYLDSVHFDTFKGENYEITFSTYCNLTTIHVKVKPGFSGYEIGDSTKGGVSDVPDLSMKFSGFSLSEQQEKYLEVETLTSGNLKISPYNNPTPGTMNWYNLQATPTTIWFNSGDDSYIWIFFGNISKKISTNHSSEYYSDEYVPYTGSSADKTDLKRIFEEEKNGLSFTFSYINEVDVNTCKK